MLLQRFRHFVSCQGVTIKSVNYFINFHQISWPFASSSQALYVRTRSKVPSDSFASECNLSPGEAAKLLKLHFYPGKKWGKGLIMLHCKKTKEKQGLNDGVQKKLCFSMFLLASRLDDHLARFHKRIGSTASRSPFNDILTISELIHIDSHLQTCPGWPRMQESNDCMSNHVCGDGNTSLKDFPVKSIKGEDAAWTSRPWLESLESCEVRLKDW